MLDRCILERSFLVEFTSQQRVAQGQLSAQFTSRSWSKIGQSSSFMTANCSVPAPMGWSRTGMPCTVCGSVRSNVCRYGAAYAPATEPAHHSAEGLMRQIMSA